MSAILLVFDISSSFNKFIYVIFYSKWKKRKENRAMPVSSIAKRFSDFLLHVKISSRLANLRNCLHCYSLIECIWAHTPTHSNKQTNKFTKEVTNSKPTYFSIAIEIETNRIKLHCVIFTWKKSELIYSNKFLLEFVHKMGINYFKWIFDNETNLIYYYCDKYDDCSSLIVLNYCCFLLLLLRLLLILWRNPIAGKCWISMQVKSFSLQNIHN